MVPGRVRLCSDFCCCSCGSLAVPATRQSRVGLLFSFFYYYYYYYSLFNKQNRAEQSMAGKIWMDIPRREVHDYDRKSYQSPLLLLVHTLAGVVGNISRGRRDYSLASLFVIYLPTTLGTNIYLFFSAPKFPTMRRDKTSLSLIRGA
ncbi:hypothetical protein F4809DRAFT_412507 [Biscogniauxia mediterranea]|nr:hypothetical protein F4809DRAFT_412507 [Biscogniauxia mediterranea]